MKKPQDILTMPHEQLEAIQLEGIKKTVITCYENVEFYRNAFDEAGFDPYAVETFADLEKAPFTTRQYPEAARETLLVLDATTGKNAISQVEQFGDVAALTGVVITKLDGTAKGGIAITIADQFDLPIKFIGVGEGINDLKEFEPAAFVGGIFDE